MYQVIYVCTLIYNLLSPLSSSLNRYTLSFQSLMFLIKLRWHGGIFNQMHLPLRHFEVPMKDVLINDPYFVLGNIWRWLVSMWALFMVLGESVKDLEQGLLLLLNICLFLKSHVFVNYLRFIIIIGEFIWYQAIQMLIIMFEVVLIIINYRSKKMIMTLIISSDSHVIFRKVNKLLMALSTRI